LLTGSLGRYGKNRRIPQIRRGSGLLGPASGRGRAADVAHAWGSHADQVPRTFPTSTNDATQEMIHYSVLGQLPDALKDICTRNPGIVCKLLPFEEKIWNDIKYVPGKYPSIPEPEESEGELQWAAEEAAKKVVAMLYAHL